MSSRAEKTQGAAAGFATLALGMIRNPGLRSYVNEQLDTARTEQDRAAALAILMDSIGWTAPEGGRTYGPH